MKDNTPTLFIYIKQGELRPFKQMVELYDADLEDKYVSGYNAFLECVFIQNYEFTNYIIKHMKEKYKQEPLKFKKFLNAKSSDGKTALMIATLSHENTKIIEELLNYGADVNVLDLHGKKVKDYAIYAISDEVESFWNNYKEVAVLGKLPLPKYK